MGGPDLSHSITPTRRGEGLVQFYVQAQQVQGLGLSPGASSGAGIDSGEAGVKS